MGLDAWIYRSIPKKNRTEMVMTLRKNWAIHTYCEKVWEEKGRPGLPEDEEDKHFNCIELELSKEDVLKIAELITEDDIDRYGRSLREPLLRLAEEMDKEGCKVWYDSWW